MIGQIAMSLIGGLTSAIVIKSNLYVRLGTALRLQSGRIPVCIRTFASRNPMENASLA